MPTLPEESVDSTPDIELIERGPYALDDGVAVDEETVERRPVLGWVAAGLAAVGILVALVVISRPGLEEDAGAERAQTTLAPTTQPPTTPSSTVTSAPTTTVVPAAAPFEPYEDLPDDLPGVLSGFDARGALVVIDPGRPQPVETELDAVPTDETPIGALGVGGGSMVGVNRELEVFGVELAVAGVTAQRTTADLTELVSDGVGGVLVVTRVPDVQLVTWHELDDVGDDDGSTLAWGVPSTGIEVLGRWGDELLVHRSDQVSAVATDGAERPVASGLVLAYDGRHLARLVCEGVSSCEVLVGPPDDPDARAIRLPTELERNPVDEWAPTVAVSPDGTRLAAVYRQGAVLAPLVVDLVTGELTSWGEGLNPGSPMAFSPDGQWLGFLFDDDVIVRNLNTGRSTRLIVGRDLESLIWR